jgi:hypothetical protein
MSPIPYAESDNMKHHRSILIVGLYSALGSCAIVVVSWLWVIAPAWLDPTRTTEFLGRDARTVEIIMWPVHLFSWLSLLLNATLVAGVKDGSARRKLIVAIAVSMLAIILSVPLAFHKSSGCVQTVQGLICT